jgi:hypothetical protein
MGRRYASVEAFYRDPERWMSTERDLGLRWEDADGAGYRAAWIERTEELYCVRYRTPEGDGGQVEVLACIPGSRVDRELAGWSEVCGEPESFEWLRDRALRCCGGRVRVTRPARTRTRQRAPVLH